MSLEEDNYLAFAGNYASETERSIIQALELDSASGSIGHKYSVDENDPVFLALSSHNNCIYATSQNKSADTGEVASYGINQAEEELNLLNRKPTGADRRPSHLGVDQNDDYLFAANYEGSISVFPLDESGELRDRSHYIETEGSSIHPRQDSSHPHSVNPSPFTEDPLVYVPDLGADEVKVYELEEEGQLDETNFSPIKVAPGSGPRHMDFCSGNEKAYLLNELDSSIMVFDTDPFTGDLDHIQTVETLPDSFDGENFPADIHVHPSEEFVYSSNRGHDSISQFEIKEDGRLELVDTQSTYGESPRNFAFTSEGDYLLTANRDSDEVVVFEVEENTGGLNYMDEIAVSEPACLEFLD